MISLEERIQMNRNPLLSSIMTVCAVAVISAESHAQPRANNWYQQPAAQSTYANYPQAGQYPSYQYPAQQRQVPQPPAQQRPVQPSQQIQQLPQASQSNVNLRMRESQNSNQLWLSDFDTARAQAQQQGRPLVALFVHHGCPECDRFDAILAQPGSMQVFDNAVKARIEFTQNPEVVNRLGLKFTPTLLVFTPAGDSEVYREVGAVSQDRLRQLKPSIDSLVTGPAPEPPTRKQKSKRS